MRLRACVVLVVSVGLSSGACSQVEGPVPTPSASVLVDLDDVARDLQNVASARDPQASQELADDLRKYTDTPDAAAAVEDLSQRTAAVLAGVDLAEEPAQRLAETLWRSLVSSELSEQQVETLQSDVLSLLMAEGVAEESAQQVVAQIGEVQGAVATRTRRWYELF